MKQIVVLISFILSFQLFGQVSFDKKADTLTLINGVDSKASIKITNNSGHDIDLEWKLISSTLNDNLNGVYPNNVSWKLQFCDCKVCSSNDFGPLPDSVRCPSTMTNGSSLDWYLTADPNGQPIVDGKWVIEVFNITDNIKDTLTYFAAAPKVSQVSFDKKADTLTLVNGVDSKASIKITNNSGHDINLEWKLLSSTLNDNLNGVYPNNVSWKLQFCDCKVCYSNDFGPLPDSVRCPSVMTDGSSLDWYLTADPNGQPIVDGKWVIEVFNITDNTKDTLTYFAAAPNSVRNVTYNANISSYPNPANSELVVNYELTNVSSPILNVYNIIGGKVGTYELNSVTGTLNLNTSDFENGMYFFTIEEKEQRVFIQKFNVVH